MGEKPHDRNASLKHRLWAGIRKGKALLCGRFIKE